MHTILPLRLIALVLFFASTLCQAENFVHITATKKVGQKDRGDRQAVGNAQGQLNTRAVYYDFNVRTVSAKIPQARAEWVVLTETLGLVMPADHGERMLDLNLGHSINWQSDPIDLKELEFKGIPEIGRGEIETAIEGYGIRLIDRNGTIIGEKYSSSRVKPQASQILARLSTASGNTSPTTIEKLIKMLIEKAKSLPPPPEGPPSRDKLPGGGPPKRPFER
jgi:hypothetical protein